MRLKVCLETCCACELLPAQDTDLFLAENLVLACAVVNAHVGAHVAAPVEQPRADRARKWLNAGVHESMLLQTRGALECLAAEFACKRSVRRMDGHVQVEMKQMFVRLSACLADIRTFTCMYSHVASESSTLAERTTAHAALVSHLSSVTPHVHVQIGQPFERLRTFGTRDSLLTDRLLGNIFP